MQQASLVKAVHLNHTQNTTNERRTNDQQGEGCNSQERNELKTVAYVPLFIDCNQ